MLRTEITKSHLNNHICQHRGMKTSTVTPSFYYVFNISLYCNDSIPSFIGNLWRVLLLGNYLKSLGVTLSSEKEVNRSSLTIGVSLEYWSYLFLFRLLSSTRHKFSSFTLLYCFSFYYTFVNLVNSGSLLN